MGTRPRFLTSEPANEVVRARTLEMDPGFDAARDLCEEDFAYVTVLRRPIARVHSHMCERGASFRIWQDPTVGPKRHRLAVNKQLRDNYYVRSLGGADAWDAPEGAVTAHGHLLAAARTLARFHVVMTVEGLSSDSPAQMGCVGLPGFRWQHYFSRSRGDNRERAARDGRMRSPQSRGPSCDVPPTEAEQRLLVDGVSLDHVLYEFARVLAARRTAAAAAHGG